MISIMPSGTKGIEKAFVHQMLNNLDISPILDYVLQKGLQLTRTDLGNVQLMDWNTGYLTITAQRGFSEDFLEFFRTVRGEDGSACGRAVRHRGPIVIEDVLEDAEFAPCRPIALEAGFRAVQSTPLISRNGAFFGVLSTHFPHRHRPSERELKMLQALGEVAANAIIVHQSRAQQTDYKSIREETSKLSKAALHELDRSLEFLQHLCAGERVFPGDLALGLKPNVPSSRTEHRFDSDLAPGEWELLAHLVAGRSNKTIAQHLGIAEATVKVHLKNLLRSIKVDNRTQAAVWALSNLPDLPELDATPRGFV
jgi:DNA-binding NarL/FixJ family response regulator